MFIQHASQKANVTRGLPHLLPQSEAFQGDVLAHQGNGVWELYIEVSRIFPVVT